MMMKQIEAFVAVAKHRSFSHAAEDLFLSQPTISAYISALEEEMGVNLIIRSTKSVYLSEAGKIFYEYAVETLGSREEIKRTLKHYFYEMRGTVNIPAHPVPAQFIVPLLLQKFVSDYPEIMIKIYECSDSEVVDNIIGTRAQIGITGSMVSNIHCMVKKIFKDRFIVVAPNLPEYAEMGVLDPKSMETLKFVGWRNDSELARFYHPFFQQANIKPKLCNIVFESGSHEGALQAVRNGLGITVTTKLCAESLLATDELIELKCDFEMPIQNYYLVCHKTRPLNPISSAIKKAILSWGKTKIKKTASEEKQSQPVRKPLIAK